MRYIKGRSNLSCTIFVPWDCKNHCKFCTSKNMYKERTCDMEAILAQIKKINENPMITEYVLTGGEPLADLEKAQILIDAMDKPVYINTTFPKTDNFDKICEFLNKNDRINGINISRHMHQKFIEDVEDVIKINEYVNKFIKLNVVLSKEFDIEEFDRFIEPYKNLNNIVICIRADYRKITKDTLKNRDYVFAQLMKKYEYESSGGCMVCNDDRFYDAETELELSYHRGLQSSLVKYGNRRYVGDVIITIDGMVYPDWDMNETDIDFERWLFGDYTLDDDIEEYSRDVEFIDWLLKKNNEKGILDE